MVMKAIRRDPDERYRSASAFQKDLHNYADLKICLSSPSDPEAAVSGGVLTTRQIGCGRFWFLSVFWYWWY